MKPPNRITQAIAIGLSGVLVDGATPAAASAFMHELGETVSNRTFDGYAATLKLIYKTIYKQLGMPENPFENIRHRPLETVSRKEFTEEQVQKIFDGFQTGFFYETEVEGLGPGRKRKIAKHIDIIEST